MKLKPLSDRIVLESKKAEDKTKSGIILPETSKEKPMESKVIAVGPGKLVDGKRIKMDVKVGDIVLTSKYAGTDIKIDGKSYSIVQQSDILAIVVK